MTISKIKNMFLSVAVLAIAIISFGASYQASAQISGAVFTTNSECNGTNLNLFPSKDAVYLDGGPRMMSAAGLPDGFYYVKVTSPSGVILGKSLTAVAEVAAGEFVQCYRLSEVLYTASSGYTDQGYDDTLNAGGEYKVWASKDPNFANSASKTDNFKVDSAEQPNKQYNIAGCKFYDANANNIWDNGEVAIPGFKIVLTLNNVDEFVTYTGTDGCYNFGPIAENIEYRVAEVLPTGTWVQSFPADSPNGRVHEGITTAPGCNDAICTIGGLNFGNYCTTPGNGRTMGFWSNNNGQALITAGDITQLVAFNLRSANGSNFDPASKSTYRTWLLSANATNMAYMLSAQMSATYLNTQHGFTNGGSLVIVNGQIGTVNNWINLANASLGTSGFTVSGHADRSYQENLKNIFDSVNNTNFVYVNPTPCGVVYE
jgi:hypothetical protein